MEIKKYNYFLKVTTLLLLVSLMIGGCTSFHQTFRDYDNAWVSSEPYIYIPVSNSDLPYYAEVEIDGEIIPAEIGSAFDGTEIDFYIPLDSENDGYSEDNIIWEASVEIIDDVMYLTVDIDNYGDNEGKTFILEQAEYESAE